MKGIFLEDILDRARELIRRIDPVLFICATLLSIISILTVFGAVENFGMSKLRMQIFIFIIGVIVTVVISCIVLFAQQKRRFFSVMKQTKRSAFYLALASLVVAGAIHLLTAMLGMMDLALLYTFDNSGVLMFSVLCSWIFFKEKLSLKNWLGCAAMCIALTLMMGWDWIFPM